MKLFAVIVAAGAGERFGSERLKQLTPLAGRPMLAWSIDRLHAHPAVAGIVCVVPPDRVREIRDGLEAHGAGNVTAWAEGGETRQQSVRAGLAAVPDDATHVMIHDGARPCLGAELLARLTTALRSHDAVVPGLAAVDTIAREREGRIESIVDRTQLARMQTPQAFEISLIRRAHEHAEAKGLAGSDDGSLVLALGEPVVTVAGERTNVKVTYAQDVPIAEAILKSGVII